MQATNAGQQRHVHTQRFAFRAPQEDDESVKMSNPIRRRSSALSLTLPATRSSVARLHKHRFLFDTNKPFSPNTNFSTCRKQSSSFFLFDTNEQSQITSHRPLFTRFRGLRGRSGTPPFPLRQISMPCGLTPPSPLRTMRRMQRKRCPGAPTNR